MAGFWTLTALVLLAAGCARSHPPPPRTASSELLPNAGEPQDVAVVRSGDVIGYSGVLTLAGLGAARRLDDASAKTFMVRSPGGEVGVGMDFGDWVHARHFDVVVVDYCVSSCANYVFPAGRAKTVLPGGVVAWHGDVLLQGTEDDLAKMIDGPEALRAEQVRQRAARHAYIDAMKAKQEAFFARIAVSECLCRIGNERLGARGLYFMSIEDMMRFGVDRVVAGPRRECDVAEDVRDKLGLTFVTVPAGWDAPTACRSR